MLKNCLYITTDGSQRLGELQEIPRLSRDCRRLTLRFANAGPLGLVAARSGIKTVFSGGRGWTQGAKRWKPLTQTRSGAWKPR